MGKSRKLILTVKEFNKEIGVTDYNINGIDNVKALYFVRYPQGQFEDLPKGDYEVIQDSNNQILRIKNTELLNKAERFQVGYLFDFSSSKYEVEFGADVNILKDRYNELVDDVEELFKYIKENMMGADGQDVDTILPQLDTDEVWVKTATGYRGLNIGNLEENIKEMLKQIEDLRNNIFKEMLETKDRYIREIDNRFEQEVVESQNRIIATGTEQVELVTNTGNTKISEINSTFEEKNTILTQTGDTKNQLLIDTFNKKNSALISTGDTKKQEIVDLTVNKIAEIENKGNEEVGLVTDIGDEQVARVTKQGDIEVQRVIDAGVTGKVNRSGDTMTGNLSMNGADVVINDGHSIRFTPKDDSSYSVWGFGAVDDKFYLGEVEKELQIRGGDIKLMNETKMADNVSLHLYGNGKIFTANNYGILGRTTDGVDKYMLLMDTSNNFHLGWNKEHNIVFDAPQTFFNGIPEVQSETAYMYFKDTRSGSAEGRAYIGFGSADASTQKFQIVNPASNVVTLELDGKNAKIVSSHTYSTSHNYLLTYGAERKGVYASSTHIGFTKEDGAWVFNVDNSGNILATSNVTAFSDIKLKKDFEVIPNALDKIKTINGYTYTRKDSGERQAGVIAQEIEKVLPEVVISTKNTNGEETLSVAYGNIVALLIEGIKEQQKKIDSLEERLSYLEELVVV